MDRSTAHHRQYHNLHPERGIMLELPELTSADITELLKNGGKAPKKKTGTFVMRGKFGATSTLTQEHRSTPGWLVGNYTTPDRYKAPRSISGKARNNPHYLLETDVVAYSTKRS